MKVALCTEILYPIYGVERRVYEMARRFKKFHVYANVYTSSSQQELPEIKIRQMSRRTVTKPPKRNYAFCAQYVSNLFRELSRRNNDYDVIDANGHLSLIPCASAGLVRKKPVVATIHDLYLDDWKKMYRGRGSFFGMPFELLSSKMPFAKIITLNSTLKSRMINRLRIPASQIEIIPSGIDFKHIRKVKVEKRKDDRILYVGRLVPQKNIDILIKAFSEIEDAELVIIGEGSEETKLKKMVKYMGLDSVNFAGSLKNYDDVIREMKMASMLVLPSSRENFGIVPLEAMACGTPVVSTATEGPVDYIDSGRNGFITPIGDATALKKAMQTLLSEKKLRRKFSSNGVKTAMRYDWDEIVRRITDVYSEVLSGY
jgi:glycosyltransferase involved in cell wall biosynthesis